MENQRFNQKNKQKTDKQTKETSLADIAGVMMPVTVQCLRSGIINTT